jgi:manganese efflux pump family protein
LDNLSLLGTAFALGMDAFAVSVAVAACLPMVTARHAFRLTWHFGLFQSMMTFLGWLGGDSLTLFLSGISYWIAFFLLVGLGLNMIRESRRPEDWACDYDPTRGWSLVGLSVATSIDALAVGVSFGLLEISVPRPALIIGLMALVMTFVGMKLGHRVGFRLGKWAEMIGGFVLIGIGARILVEHLIG